MVNRLLLPVLCALVLAGCSKTSPQIAVNAEQSLVMEASVLAAGVTAQKPDFSMANMMPVATSRLYNERNTPVTINYRFYWYDSKGLEMHPLDAPGTVTIPADSGITVRASSQFLAARKVRLYLYL